VALLWPSSFLVNPRKRLALTPQDSHKHPRLQQAHPKYLQRRLFCADPQRPFAQRLDAALFSGHHGSNRKEFPMEKTILILNGPNLNLLGHRQPEIYGRDTLDDVAAACTALGAEHGLTVDLRQSNHEGELIDWIHEARNGIAGIIINPGAYTHTSIAILDALKAYEGPVIEVHISNIHKRESFRHLSFVSLRADGVIAGLGVEGYQLALRRMVTLTA
jgi:3-dehydroquinate dehydratase-2